MNYKILFFIVFTVSIPQHNFCMMCAFRAGFRGFKESLQHDLQTHAQLLENHTTKEVLKYDIQLQLALQNKQSLEKKLAQENTNIKKLKLKKMLFEQASSFAQKVQKKFFSYHPKQITDRYLLDEKKTNVR